MSTKEASPPKRPANGYRYNDRGVERTEGLKNSDSNKPDITLLLAVSRSLTSCRNAI